MTHVHAVEAALPRDWSQRLDELSRLKEGWRPDAQAPAAGTIQLVADFLQACIDEAIARPGIFPTAEGGIQLEWPGGKLVEVEFGVDGQISAFIGKDVILVRETGELDELLRSLKGALH